MLIDLDSERQARAARREGAGQHVEIAIAGESFRLPAELPVTVLERLLDPDVEISQMLILALRAYQQGSEQAGEIIIRTLSDQPDLPLGFLRAVMSAVELLFGTDEWARFQAADPSAQDVIALIKGLFTSYGVGLGEAFSSPASSEIAGSTPSPTSSGSTGSTSEELMPLPDSADFLESAG